MAETRCEGRSVVLQAALTLGPALIASPPEPGVELVLNSPLDDQTRAEPGEVPEHLLRVIDHALPKQPIDVGLYLR